MIIGVILSVFGAIQIVAETSTSAQSSLIYPTGIAILSIGIILLPFGVYKARGIAKQSKTGIIIKAITINFSLIHLILLALLWGLLLIFGYSFVGRGLIPALITPFLAVLVILLPIIVFLSFVLSKSYPIVKTSLLGSISVGATAGPLFSALIEVGIVSLIGIFIFVLMAQDPSSINNLRNFASRISSAQNNPEIINNIVSGFLQNPVNKYLVIAFLSGIVPIVEELIKQLPIWLLAWRRLSPRAGFIIGAMGGAGFAVTEGLLTIPTIGDSEEWAFQLIGRAGTTLMHIATGSITGWGLASSFQDRGYIIATRCYLTSILIHGVWNYLAIKVGLGRLLNDFSMSVGQSTRGIPISGITLVSLFIVLLIFLIYNHKILRD